MEFIYGLIIGNLLCLGIRWGINRLFGRNGGHIEKRIGDDIKREGILNKRIEKLQGELLVARSEVSEARSEIRDVRKRIVQAENRVKSTDGLIADLKKRNNLE